MLALNGDSETNISMTLFLTSGWWPECKSATRRSYINRPRIDTNSLGARPRVAAARKARHKAARRSENLSNSLNAKEQGVGEAVKQFLGSLQQPPIDVVAVGVSHGLNPET